jgi:cardiolipin synthase
MSAAGILTYGLFGALVYAAVIGLILVLIYEERDPSTTLVWALVLALLPGLGIVLFVVFGLNQRLFGRLDRRRSAAVARGDETLAPVYARHFEAADRLAHDGPPIVGQLISAIRTQNGTSPLPCTDLEIFASGAAMFERLFEDIEGAHDHIHLEYFIWEQDELTARLCALLAEKVAQGVEVRVLYDWIGSIGYGKRQLHDLRRAGAQVRADSAKWIKLNYRNHRKIAVVDGRVAHTGGMNMGQEYIDGKPRYASWRDTDIRFGGPLVADLQRLFCERWARTTAEDLFSARYFPELDTGRATATVWAQVVHSGPESKWPAVRNAFMVAIGSAERRVRVQSPYFVPDQGIEDVLVAQALSGVETSLMMTGVPDKRIAWWAASTYLDDLVEAGGRVFQYHAGFFHAKTMTVDDIIAVIGTTNFDIRSFALHDELSVVFYDEGVTAAANAIFDNDILGSAEITLEDVRAVSGLERMRNALARLSSRLL